MQKVFPHPTGGHLLPVTPLALSVRSLDNVYKQFARIFAEMEKRADGADASVLFFPLAVLIFWLYTCKLA